MMPEQIKSIKKILSGEPDCCSMWHDALIIKSSPHNLICRLYGAALNNEGEVKLFDGENWYTLEAKDSNIDYVAPAVLQRLKYLQLNNNEKEADIQWRRKIH